jgi:hypothetical protein
VVEVAVKRGKNAGKTLPHKNVVREMILLGPWRGEAAKFAAEDPDLRKRRLRRPRVPGLRSRRPGDSDAVTVDWREVSIVVTPGRTVATPETPVSPPATYDLLFAIRFQRVDPSLASLVYAPNDDVAVSLAISCRKPDCPQGGMTVNHHQRKILHAIFAHPLNANLEMKDIVNVLNGLGAEIDAKSKGRLGVTLNGRVTVLHLAIHSLLKADVMQIRKFLESCGITAEAYPV